MLWMSGFAWRSSSIDRFNPPTAIGLVAIVRGRLVFFVESILSSLEDLSDISVRADGLSSDTNVRASPDTDVRAAWPLSAAAHASASFDKPGNTGLRSIENTWRAVRP